jgi:hypothetical protein
MTAPFYHNLLRIIRSVKINLGCFLSAEISEGGLEAPAIHTLINKRMLDFFFLEQRRDYNFYFQLFCFFKQ